MKRAIAALVLAFVLAACGPKVTSTGTPTAPNSPQTTIALTVKTVDDTANAGVQTVIALRDGGKLSQANTTTIENWLKFVFATDKSINVILANGQPWAAQKTAILTLLATVTAPTVATNIDPGAQALVASIMTLVNQIRVGVSQ